MAHNERRDREALFFATRMFHWIRDTKMGCHIIILRAKATSIAVGAHGPAYKSQIIMDQNSSESSDLSSLTGELVAAYVSNNRVSVSELPSLIASVHAALSGLGKPAEEPTPDTKASSAEVRKSIKPDALISFIDGKPYKTLKRHLTRHGMSGAEYRTKYGLPADYPLVAASYAAQRSALAKSLGLGQLRRTADKEAAGAAQTLDEMTDSVVEAGNAEASSPKKRPGRPRKAPAEA